MKNRRILMVGYGSIAQALTPLLLRHFSDLNAKSVSVVTADERGRNIAGEYGISFHINPLLPENYGDILSAHVGAGDILLNLSVEVSTKDLVLWCQSHGVMYLDTCVEPWQGGYDDTDGNVLETTNYWLRNQILKDRGIEKPTCVIAHGANPGLVSHFVKKGLVELGKIHGISERTSKSKIAQEMGVKVVQIAERDTQNDGLPLREGEFFNTWSVDGLLSEAKQRAEMGWGTHEDRIPHGAMRHDHSAAAGLIMGDVSAHTKVKSWVPSQGQQSTYMVTHHEGLSIADYLSEKNSRGETIYRPTVYYAYRPADKTCASLNQWVGNGFKNPATKVVMREHIKSGQDELGVLFVHGDVSPP